MELPKCRMFTWLSCLQIYVLYLMGSGSGSSGLGPPFRVSIKGVWDAMALHSKGVTIISIICDDNPMPSPVIETII